jgi:hypothetical protein
MTFRLQCFRRLSTGAAAFQLFNEEILFKTHKYSDSVKHKYDRGHHEVSTTAAVPKFYLHGMHACMQSSRLGGGSIQPI